MGMFLVTIGEECSFGSMSGHDKHLFGLDAKGCVGFCANLFAPSNQHANHSLLHVMEL
jgi:hypothetical protein